jgi:hypothetical protein
MANTTKKTTVKKATAKKPVAKKAPVKKVVAPVIEKHPCGCGGECACHKHHCSFWKKLIVALVFFALGFAAAKTMPCHKRFNKMPKPEFENGCLVVKCPKMAEMIEKIDINADGCVDESEFKAFKKEMRPQHSKARGPRGPKAPQPQQPEAPVAPAEQPVAQM